MVISEDSQLGLRFKKNELKIAFLTKMKNNAFTEKSRISEEIEMLQQISDTEIDKEERAKEVLDQYEQKYKISLIDSTETLIKRRELKDRINKHVSKATNTTFPLMQSLIREGIMTKYFFICDSVYKAAELIKIGDNFTGRAINTIKHGHYTYLMGKNRMIRFMCCPPNVILGFYWDNKNDIAFEFGIDTESGDFYAPIESINEFSMIMQIMVFVELGDVEIKYINARKKLGDKKKPDHIMNSSNNTVYVVDSTWNQILIRTDGFAVRGHFRLQPCGVAMNDRKLIWISAFEKQGYTRRPKGEIVK